MAVESARGCGYRKAGGLYLVGGGIGVPCDRLPYEIHECPCCHSAISKQTIANLQWLDIGKYVKGPHMVREMRPLLSAPGEGVVDEERCLEAQTQRCTFCAAPELMGEVLVHWVGEEFYTTPADFIAEGIQQGFSRRIKSVPQGFKLGKTYVFLAHPKAVTKQVEVPPEKAARLLGDPLAEAYEQQGFPGFFYIWIPQRLEKIFDESQRGGEEVAAAEKRGIVPVFVPDNDPDHHGSVHKKKAKDGNLPFETEA